jgi:hypothetical protein
MQKSYSTRLYGDTASARIRKAANKRSKGWGRCRRPRGGLGGFISLLNAVDYLTRDRRRGRKSYVVDNRLTNNEMWLWVMLIIFSFLAFIIKVCGA